MTRLRRRALAAALLVASAVEVHAQSTLPTIQVTATRTPQPVARAGSAITVISAEEIARESIRDIADVLRRVPGLSLTRAGGTGATQTVRLRGGDVRHTLVLIDGIRVNDPSSTGREFDFSTLVPADIERVEVLRGPQSALYGSDAMGGVVNIVTKRGRSGPPKASLTVEAGSYATREMRGGVSGGDGRVWYSLGLSALDSAGFSSWAYRIPRLRTLHPYPLEADGAERLGLTGRLGIMLDDVTSFEIGASANRNRAEYDAAYGAAPDTPSAAASRLGSAYARLTHEAFDRTLRNQLTLFGNATRRTFRDVSYFDYGGPLVTLASRNRYEGDRTGIEYQGDKSLGGLGTLTFGAKIERETADIFSRDLTTPPSAELRDVAADQTTRSVYALHQVSIAERWHVSVGGRIDDVRDTDTFTTWRVTSAYEIFETGTKLRASAGTGGKAPSLFQLHSPLYGTPGLESERSVGLDAGIDQRLFDDRLTLSATAFLNRYRNLIDFTYDPAACGAAQVYGCYLNVGRAETSGLEVSADLDLLPGLARLRATYTWLEARDLATDLRLARRPEHEGRLALSLTAAPGLTLEPRLILVGERFSAGGETQKLQPYARFDIQANYRLGDNLTLFARGENLTDARYEEVAGYGTTGRAIYGGIRATW